MKLRHIAFSSYQTPLPIYMETLGYNPYQESINRPEGYPHFHWLQTLRGEGLMEREGTKEALKENSGILLFPDVAHTYEAVGETWETLYITFDGPATIEVLRSLGIYESAYFAWESGTPFASYLLEMLERIDDTPDPFGLHASSDVYRFMVTLQKYGQLHKKMAISSNLVQLQPLLDWMESHYTDPDIGLEELAARLSVSTRKLNHLFRETFNLTPYAYFLFLRIRKAKEALIRQPELSVGEISGSVGFRDASHFVATFRRHVGQTPEQFRRLH